MVASDWDWPDPNEEVVSVIGDLKKKSPGFALRMALVQGQSRNSGPGACAPAILSQAGMPPLERDLNYSSVSGPSSGKHKLAVPWSAYLPAGFSQSL